MPDPRLASLTLASTLADLPHRSSSLTGAAPDLSDSVLRLPAECPIIDAARTALDRPIQSTSEEIVVEFVDGTLRYIDAHSVLLAQGHLLRLARSTLDRQNETALAHQAKSEVLAHVSHEIRTPLNGILGMTELALATELTGEQRDYLETIKASADALLAIISDILDFSKIEAGRLELDPVDFPLRDTIDYTLRPFAPRADAKGVKLSWTVPPDVPDRLVGDSVRLRQVLVNLVGNAIKFTGHGEVVVKVEPVKNDLPAAGQLAGLAQSVGLHFSVADTGVGIATDKLATIFQPFEQADTATTRKYGGTGLGLAISARLVAMMGGTIWVESQPGQGSTFHFTTRFGYRDEAPARSFQLGLKGLEDVRVLLMDSDTSSRMQLEQMLRGWGLETEVADGAAAARQALMMALEARRPFDLGLLDATPDALLLLEDLARQPESLRPAIILLSATQQPVNADRVHALGVSVHLQKPVHASDLLDAILTVLPARVRAAPRPTHGKAAHSGPSLRILVAEDNAVNQKLAQVLLQQMGHQVRVVGTGKEVLAALAEEPFDLVLMDVQMPDMDGIETTRALRARERDTGRHIPVVALTAHALATDRNQCLAAGMDAYLSKPLRRDELAKVIARLFPNGTETPEVPGDRARHGKLAEIFLDECPRLMGQIRDAIVRRDGPSLHRSAHLLHGSAVVFGARAACEAAHRLEMMGRIGDWTRIDDVFAVLQRKVFDLESQLASSMAAP
jgi:signal transduction histidine kinase/CheY-like chemotaxis protein